MSDSRTKNTKRNIIFSYMDVLITFFFRFISRTVIVRTLGEQYLGLSSLFTSVLGVLSMAELGFSSAIVFNMYKPIAEKDLPTVRALLRYYRTIYRRIGVFILITGTAMAPLIPNLIKGDTPEDINLYLLYFLYLLNTGVSYLLFAYKTALLNALQRMDLAKVAYAIADFFQYTMQIISLLAFRNYYLFVFWMLIGTVAKNFFAAYISNKKFPQYFCDGDLKPAIKSDILSRVKGLLVCNISGVTYTTLDSIILSSFIGLSTVAIYNNYIVIWNAVASFIVLIRRAMQASVGNSVALESREKNYRDMQLWQFLFSVIATFCVTCMLSLYQPFMKIWMGTRLLLPIQDVVLLCCWFFVNVVQHSYYLYLSGNGLWWELRWAYICATVCNLLLNIILGKKFGTTGIIFASLFANTAVGLFWQCSIIFKLYFKRSAKDFWLQQACYFVVGGISAGFAFIINECIEIDSFIGLIIRLMICVISSVGIQYILYRKTENFARAKGLFHNVMSK